MDSTAFQWHDNGWNTPDPSQLILYEMSVYGFTEGDPDIDPSHQGKFKGITERIQNGYFDHLGVTALSLMPLAEFPSMQGPKTLGYDPSLNLGDMFYFSKQNFANHTNNVVNYSESHDEHSVPHELHDTLALDNPAAKDRKGRLGLFSTLVALGQPMIYMGQEFNTERPRNIVTVDWPTSLKQHGFFQQDPTAIRTNDGNFGGFTLPSSSGFIYKWEAS